MTTSRTAMFGANLSLEQVLLQLGHFPSVAMHLRIHIEQNVCEQDVMTGFDRNSLHTSQRNAASRGSNCGRVVANQSVESGRSKVEFMRVFGGVMGATGVLARCDDESVKIASDATIDASRSRAVFVACALSASKGCRFRESEGEKSLTVSTLCATLSKYRVIHGCQRVEWTGGTSSEGSERKEQPSLSIPCKERVLI